jgi:poly(hydroxyalkanoate) depolymerase family esterase
MIDSMASRLLRAARLARPAALKQPAEVIKRALASAAPLVANLPTTAAAPGLLSGLERLSPLRHPTAPKSSPLPPGAAFQSGSFASDAGTRPYRLYVPARKLSHPPLIVMLHGCTQTAEDFAAGTRMNSLAEAAGALVLYPVQTSRANAQRCWNWFNPADQAAGQGEPAIIAGMTRQVMAQHKVDPARVFVAGLSAGGAQAAIMGAAYPELYAAIGVHSGLACGAASDMVSAFGAMRKAQAGQGKIRVPAIVFHGDSDSTVNVGNAEAVVAQVATPGRHRTEHGNAPGGLSWTRTVQPAAHGAPMVEQWIIHGAGHAWSGGSPDGSYTEPRGPDASREMLRFFLDTPHGH